MTSTSTSLRRSYGLSTSQLGLCFLANGGGCLIGSVITGPLLNRDYRAITRKVELRRLETEATGTVAVKTQRSLDVNNLLAFPIEHSRLRSLRALYFPPASRGMPSLTKTHRFKRSLSFTSSGPKSLRLDGGKARVPRRPPDRPSPQYALHPLPSPTNPPHHFSSSSWASDHHNIQLCQVRLKSGHFPSPPRLAPSGTD